MHPRISHQPLSKSKLTSPPSTNHQQFQLVAFFMFHQAYHLPRAPPPFVSRPYVAPQASGKMSTGWGKQSNYIFNIKQYQKHQDSQMNIPTSNSIICILGSSHRILSSFRTVEFISHDPKRPMGAQRAQRGGSTTTSFLGLLAALTP